MEENVACENPELRQLHETFSRATEFVTCNASVINEPDLLYLYGRYKQALSGVCTQQMPGLFHFRRRGKWMAWHSLGNMSKEEAMRQYIDKVADLSPEWDVSYAEVQAKKEKRQHFGPVTSTHQKTDPELAEDAKTVFDFVKEGNLNQLKRMVQSDATVKDRTDENGLSLLHWSADRGHLEIATYLISVGMDVNCKDNDGQTALHYASSCGHENVVKLLLESNAAINMFDADGLSPADVAFNTTIKDILMNAPKHQ